MRRIVKGEEPEELRRWKEDNATVPQLLRYGNLGRAQTGPIRQQMLAEQGYLCAYTMQRIQTTDDCHIEHIVPQAQPPISHERGLDYSNMLACFPGNAPPPQWNPKYPYGAQRKGGSYIDETNFVSPLSENVETRFRYSQDGNVHPNPGDTAALNSIQTLRLDHQALCELRKAAIEERVLDLDDPLSIEDAEALAAEINTPRSTGILPEFCIAISQVCIWYANAKRRNSQR